MIAEFIYGLCLEMTMDQAKSAVHSGDCEEDVNGLMQQPKIARQLRKIDPDALRKELREYGAWDDKELSDHNSNLQRLVWLAAGNLVDENPNR